jgi:hypothetical protein
LTNGLLSKPENSKIASDIPLLSLARPLPKDMETAAAIRKTPRISNNARKNCKNI